MKETFSIIKNLFSNKWNGEGFAKYPTIDNTGYLEKLEFIPDDFKDVIFFQHKA